MMNNPTPKRKDLNYYLSLPYSILLTPDEDGTWFARVLELPGCMTVGDTKEEALQLIDDAKLAWLSVRLQDGDQIPEPQLAYTSPKKS